MDVGTGIQDPGHYRRVCRGCPCREGIAAEELRDAGHSDAVFETDRLAFQGGTLVVPLDEELVRPGVAELLLGLGWHPETLAGVFL